MSRVCPLCQQPKSSRFRICRECYEIYGDKEDWPEFVRLLVADSLHHDWRDETVGDHEVAMSDLLYDPEDDEAERYVDYPAWDMDESMGIEDVAGAWLHSDLFLQCFLHPTTERPDHGPNAAFHRMAAVLISQIAGGITEEQILANRTYQDMLGKLKEHYPKTYPLFYDYVFHGKQPPDPVPVQIG